MSEKHELIGALNALLAAFADTIDEFEAAAEHVRSYASYAAYEHDVEIRRQMARQLRRLVSRLGGAPKMGGTFVGTVKRDIVHLLAGALRSERVLARLFEHEERHLVQSIRLLVDDLHLPIVVRSELADLLKALKAEIDHTEPVQAPWRGGVFLTR